ncbi:TPA: ethanolamine ammonia-lyase subunit EutB, partial [Listeria monocytogenes]|nr:ethanolamine ammonia-lyase subunit EutB [Listeria monocytogenes]
EERVAAKVVLSKMTLGDLRNNPVVPYETDEVTRIIQDQVNDRIHDSIKNWTVEELREWILDHKTTDADIKRVARGLTSEIIAAVTKLMSNLDLIYGAKKIRVIAHANTTIGLPGTFSARLQPNHPTDDPDGILASLMEGLTYGIGDAVIGLNPVDDSTDSVVRLLNKFEEFRSKWDVPTQTCVLAHVKTQMEAMRRGAPTGLVFQSIAGSEKGNTAFGFDGATIEEARQLALQSGAATGPNVMYFETGQGSELSSDAHFGVDQVTMEARCYGFAKKFDPFLVNTVVGFIGPEYLYDSKQVIRAGLEDHFMGKLTGISMGCDVCYTNHMKADQNDVENLSVLLTAAGCNFIMGIPHGDDVMLNYQTTGYHETATLRELFGLKPIKEFDQWMEKMGFSENGKLTSRAGDASIFLK